MNSKILMAFLGGAFLASGIVYLAVKEPTATVPVERTAAVASKPIYVAPAAPAPVESEVSLEPPPPRKPVEHPVKTTEHEKRSPMTSAPRIVTAELKAPSLPQQVHYEPPAPSPAPSAPPPQEPVYTPPPPVRQAEVEPPPAPTAPQPHTVTITAGTLLPVRIGETLTANHNQPGDTFLATLDQPLVVEGFVIAERGARLEGRIVEADTGGRVRGTSHLDVELVKLATADGQHVRIRTSPYQKQSQASTGTDAAKVGVGAAIGAAIGGIAGGGKGAGIGAGVGGAAGAGDVLLTRGKPATIPVETRISFRLQEPVTITERLQ